MKKSFSKRITAVFLAVVMLVSTIAAVDLSAYAVSTVESTTGYQWTQIASTDFTALGSGDGGYDLSSEYPTTEPDDSALSWRAVNTSDGTSATIRYDSNGLLVPDGYVYLYDSKTGGFPTKGLSQFRIDLEFSFNGAFSVSATDEYCLFKLSTNSSCMNVSAKANELMWENNFFAQDFFGRFHINADGSGNRDTKNGETFGRDKRITVDNPDIAIGETYHYVFTYINGFLSAELFDDDGDRVLTCGYGTTTLDPNTISGIMFGDDNNSNYAKNICYKSVSFASGAEVGEKKMVEQGRNKYLFAYFTGNNDQNIRLAVSDDGQNFEALNGNEKIFDNTPVAQYPATTTNTGIPSSGNARDPFILRKQDGTGYYIVATDLNINATDGYSNSKLLIWDVNDLSNIGDVKPWNVETCDWFNNYNVARTETSGKDFFAWAPEAIWDNEAGMYMLYWTAPTIYWVVSSNWLGQDTSHWESNAQKRLYYAYTDDFKTFYQDSDKTVELGKVFNSDGTVQEPCELFDYDFTCIDANITYDGRLYYMYFKHEDEKQLYYAVSDRANGPYCGPKLFNESDYSDYYIEGPEVFQLYDGSYNLIADVYKDDYVYDGYFALYNSNNLTTFLGNNRSGSIYLNYLTPRHGHIVNITTDEYESLIDKYGKVSFDSLSIRDGSDVNEHLVARYFNLATDPGTDSTGNGYNLTTNNISMGNDNGRVYAEFTPSSGATSGSPGTSSYATLNTSTMHSNEGFNVEDGVTFDWYGYIDVESTYSRYFEMTTASPGTLSDYTGGSYLFYAAKNGYAVCNGTTETDCWGYSQNSNYNSPGKWRHYTLTISKGYICLFIDGLLLYKQYLVKDIHDVDNRFGAEGGLKDASSESSGSPTYSSVINNNWFNNIFNNNLIIGISSFSSDTLFDGKISDFRIYDRALSPSEIETSLYKLENDIPGITLPSYDTNRVFYDPMEDMDIDGDGTNDKTAYSNTVSDPFTVDHDRDNNAATPEQPIRGLVLKTAGSQITSKYNLDTSLMSDANGITISFNMNPGSSIEGTVFNIGGSSGLTLTEDGSITFNGATATNIFNGAIGTDGWYYITLQFVRDKVGAEHLYIYCDTVKTMKIDVSGLGIVDYFTGGNIYNVYYGADTGYIDDFAIFDGTYLPNSVYLNYSLNKVDTYAPYRIIQFEEKMNQINTSNLFTNIGPAYEAYDNLMRYRDSFNYGHTVKDVEIYTELTIALEHAMLNMDVYAGPNTIDGLTHSQAGFSSSSTVVNVSPQYANNLLSYPDADSFQQCCDATETKHIAVNFDSFVWLYTGDENDKPTAPIGGGFYPRDGSGDYYGTSIWVASGDIALNDYWAMWPSSYAGKDAYMADSFWTYEYDGNVYRDDVTNSSATESGRNDYKIGTKKVWYFGTNVMTYTGSPSDTEYYTTIRPTFGGKMFRYYDPWFGSTQQEYYTYNFDDSRTKTIYVINYVPVKNALFSTGTDGNITKLQNITNYSYDIAKDFVAAYDALTSYDYRFDAVSEYDVSAMADELKYYVNILNGFTNNSNDTSKTYMPSQVDMDGIVQTASVNEKVIEAGNIAVDVDNTNTIYTTSSWSDYQESVEIIREYFTELNPKGVDNPYETNQQFIDDMESSVLLARNALVVVADFVPVDTVVNNYVAAYDNGLSDSSGEQTYTYHTYVAFANDYEYSKEIATTWDRFNTPKYDVTVSGYNSMDNSTWNTKSPQQNTIINSANNTTTSHEELDIVADYTVYNATVEELKKQDMAAFKQDYINNASSVYGLVDYNGSINGTETYNTGVSFDRSIATDAYSSQVGNGYVTANSAIYKNANQAELDAQITAILTELTNANTNTDGTKRTQYTVNFKVNVDGVVTTVGTYTANYGDSLTLDASSVVGSATCNSWEVTTGTTRRFVNESNTYTLNIQSDATVVAYATAGATDSAPIAVSILNQYNKPFHNVALAGDTTIKFTANSVTIGGTTITIPTMPNYSIGGWTATGYASEIELDKTYTLSEIAGSGTSVVFGPTLTFTKADYTVKLDGVQVAAGVYDDLVTVNSEVAGTVAIALVQDGAYYVAAYGTSYSMYLNRNVEFVSIVKDGSNYYFSSVSDANRITDTQMTNKLNGGLPFVYSIMSVTGQNSSGTNKYTTFTATSANCTIEVTEVGTLYSKTASTDDTLVMGGSGVYSAAAKNPSATTNQFSYTIATKGNLYTRGYVKYTVTYTNAGGSATMQCIDYGNICTNAAN